MHSFINNWIIEWVKASEFWNGSASVWKLSVCDLQIDTATAHFWVIYDSFDMSLIHLKEPLEWRVV